MLIYNNQPVIKSQAPTSTNVMYNNADTSKSSFLPQTGAQWGTLIGTAAVVGAIIAYSGGMFEKKESVVS